MPCLRYQTFRFTLGLVLLMHLLTGSLRSGSLGSLIITGRERFNIWTL